MNAAEKLRTELVNSNVIDKKKVMEVITEGIKSYGYAEVIVPYNNRSKIFYGDCHIEVAELNELTAIKEYALSEGFHVKTAYHPVSGRNYGYEISL